MPKTIETVLEINLTALGENYHYLKSRIKDSTRILGVVKAFGYGSDALVIAKELETLGVDYLAVAYVNEGVALRDVGVKTPILVLHPQPENFETLIHRCLEPDFLFNGLFAAESKGKFIHKHIISAGFKYTKV